MKKLLTILTAALLPLLVWAAPARPLLKTLTLPDGTVVNDAVSAGNEHFHYWLAPDGSCYDDQLQRIEPEQMRQRQLRAQSPEQLRTPGIKNLAPRGLIILANFLDVHFRDNNTRDVMDSVLNAPYYKYHKSYGSAKDYFTDQSLGQYSPIFDVVGPVQLPDSLKYYGRNLQQRRGADAKAADMVFKACSIASQMPGVDFSLYDNDNDNYLDFVFVIYAGYGESDSRIDSLIWPSSYTMASAVSSGLTSLPSNSPRSAYTFQGKTISYYAYSPELNYYNTIYRPTPGYDADHPLRAGIGLFCHEFSHVLGLPDYYDTTNGVNYNQFLTPGNWDVMDVGLYNADGYVPAAYSVHERWWMGWDAPTLLNDSMNVTMAADHQSAYYITRDGSTALSTTQDTVYYLENRQLTGWDQGLPGHGLFVLRVVYNAGSWSSNSPNNTGGAPRYIHIPADSTYTYNKKTGIQGDDGDPFPGTANVTSCTLFPNYPITDITETDGVISFKFMGGTQGEAILPTEGADEGIVTAVYSLTGSLMGQSTQALPEGIYIVRKSTGKTEKIIVR